MAKREAIEKRCEQLLEPILAERGFDLWDVEYVKEGKEYYLRVYIDKPGGIMIDDCVDVSRRLSDLLDLEDQADGKDYPDRKDQADGKDRTGGGLIEEAYTLEVSSPGLTRKLVKDREYERSIGRDVDIKFYKSVDGSKETRGRLVAFDKDKITVETDEGQRSYERSEIATVRLAADF